MRIGFIVSYVRQILSTTIVVCRRILSHVFTYIYYFQYIFTTFTAKAKKCLFRANINPGPIPYRVRIKVVCSDNICGWVLRAAVVRHPHVNTIRIYLAGLYTQRDEYNDRPLMGRSFYQKRQTAWLRNIATSAFLVFRKMPPILGF